MAEQPRLHVLNLERFAQQGVVAEVDLAYGEVIGGPPVGVDFLQFVCAEGRVGHIHNGPPSIRIFEAIFSILLRDFRNSKRPTAGSEIERCIAGSFARKTSKRDAPPQPPVEAAAGSDGRC
jgi:hypothetical protein